MSNTFWEIGKNYFIRCVTYHQVGRLVEITEKELVLEDASWIADSGRFYNALKSGKFSQVEPFVERVLVNREAIVDATLYPFDLPLEQTND